jgi:hypothetical protein
VFGSEDGAAAIEGWAAFQGLESHGKNEADGQGNWEVVAVLTLKKAVGVEVEDVDASCFTLGSNPQNETRARTAVFHCMTPESCGAVLGATWSRVQWEKFFPNS